MQLPVARLCLHPIPTLEILLRFGCDQKLTGGAPTGLCSLSEAGSTRVPLLVGFSLPLLEKKTEKEKKKSKKASLEGAPVADGSAEVPKKKKVRVRPWAGAHASSVPGWRRNRAMAWPCWPSRGACSSLWPLLKHPGLGLALAWLKGLLLDWCLRRFLSLERSNPGTLLVAKDLVLSKEQVLLSSVLSISFSAEAGAPEGLADSCIPSQGLEGVTEGERMFLLVAATSTGTCPGSLCGFAGSFMSVVHMILMCFSPFSF